MSRGQRDCFCKDCENERSVENFLSEDIVKVRFRYWPNWGYYDPKSQKEEQCVFDIFPDGTIKYFAYPRKSRRVVDKDKVKIEAERVIAFYDDVIQLYRPWNQITECEVCDGCSYELTITYSDNRKRKCMVI